MSDWAEAERIVQQMSGGVITPGSGNQRIKGDVRVGSHTSIEVKQTGKKKLTIQREWLEKMERETPNLDLILAVFFELRGYCYWLTGPHGLPDPEWRSLTVGEDNLPLYLYTKKNAWCLERLQSLREL